MNSRRRRGRRRRGRLRSGCPACIVLFLFSAILRAQTANSAGGSDPLHQLNGSVEALVRRVSPSVVQLQVTGYGPVEESGRSDTDVVIGRQRAIGSGVIIDPDGYIITNAHVVGNAQRIQAVIPSPNADDTSIRSINLPGSSYNAHVVGLSKEVDLALLKVDAHGLKALPIGKYGNLRQGELVFAFGSPEGLRNSVTMGVVSAVARQPDPDNPMVYIQTDAPINPGNSGGPLVDVDGELMGINTFIVSQSGGNEGLGFAIPSSVLALAYPQLRKYGHVHRSEIGIAVQTVTPALAEGLGLAQNWGVVVSDVLPGGPADKAGVKIKDIILTLDGRLIDNLPRFGYTFSMHAPGDPLTIEVLRGSERIVLKVPVIEPPHEVDRAADLVDPEKNRVAKLGILGIPIDSRIAEMLSGLRQPSGVLVAARTADPGGLANSLTTGDVIHALNGVPVISLDGLRSLLDEVKPGHAVVLQIERDGRFTFLALAGD